MRALRFQEAEEEAQRQQQRAKIELKRKLIQSEKREAAAKGIEGEG